MPREYVKVPTFTNREKRDYPDGALATWIEVQCLAEQQPRRGRFETIDHLRVGVSKRRRRWIRFLLEQRDIIPATDVDASADPDELYVTAWDELQEGRYQTTKDRVAAAQVAMQTQKRPLTPAEKTARWRMRRQGIDPDSVLNDGHSDGHRSRSLPSDGGRLAVSGNDVTVTEVTLLPERPANPSVTYVELTGLPLASKADRWLHDYGRRFTPSRVDAVMRELWAERQAAEGFLERIGARLADSRRAPSEPIPFTPPPEGRSATPAELAQLAEDPSKSDAVRRAARRALDAQQAASS